MMVMVVIRRIWHVSRGSWHWHILMIIIHTVLMITVVHIEVAWNLGGDIMWRMMMVMGMVILMMMVIALIVYRVIIRVGVITLRSIRVAILTISVLPSENSWITGCGVISWLVSGSGSVS